MELVGIPAGPPRPPIIPLDEARKKKLKKILTKIEL
jgi:dihydrodipicolinate synthase/N-acetylneuraminate lyase